MNLIWFDRQDSDCVETDSWGKQLWRPPKASLRPLSLCFRRCSFFWWSLCPVWIMGQDSASVGSLCWKVYPKIRRPYQGAFASFFFLLFFILNEEEYGLKSPNNGKKNLPFYFHLDLWMMRQTTDRDKWNTMITILYLIYTMWRFIKLVSSQCRVFILNCFLGCPECRLLCWQPSNRIRQPRQDHQAVEHPCSVQVHHPGS